MTNHNKVHKLIDYIKNKLILNRHKIYFYQYKKDSKIHGNILIKNIISKILDYENFNVSDIDTGQVYIIKF